MDIPSHEQDIAALTATAEKMKDEIADLSIDLDIAGLNPGSASRPTPKCEVHSLPAAEYCYD